MQRMLLAGWEGEKDEGIIGQWLWILEQATVAQVSGGERSRDITCFCLSLPARSTRWYADSLWRTSWLPFEGGSSTARRKEKMLCDLELRSFAAVSPTVLRAAPCRSMPITSSAELASTVVAPSTNTVPFAPSDRSCRPPPPPFVGVRGGASWLMRSRT